MTLRDVLCLALPCLVPGCPAAEDPSADDGSEIVDSTSDDPTSTSGPSTSASASSPSASTTEPGTTEPGTDASSGETGTVPGDCTDQMILDLSLVQGIVSEGAVTSEADGDGFTSSIDATAGGLPNAPMNPWVYLRFADAFTFDGWGAGALGSLGLTRTCDRVLE